MEVDTQAGYRTAGKRASENSERPEFLIYLKRSPEPLNFV
jgi:hypothetical protein